MPIHTSTLIIVFSTLLGTSYAHISLWHKSMYGINGTNGQEPVNTEGPAKPLENATFNQWWFHGYINDPPHDGDFLNIPAGGRATVEVATNKAFTTLGLEPPMTQCPLGPTHCQDWTRENDQPYWDVMHTSGHSNIKGCAMAIVYESDPRAIQPEDFVVVSVQRDCVWKREVNFSFPAQLRACPPGGCHCLWSWIHSFEGGTAQTTHTFMRCRVTNPAMFGKRLGKAIPAQDCASDAQKCVRGAKQPMYWKMAERNNIFNDVPNPPVYLASHGFTDGPQVDAFVDGAVPSSQSQRRSYPAITTP